VPSGRPEISCQARCSKYITLVSVRHQFTPTGRLQLKTKGAKAADFKKTAAGDKPEPNGNEKAAKAPVAKRQTLAPADTTLVKRGFVKMFVDFVVKRGSATTDDLAAEFVGRQVEGKKISKQRVFRYAHWCVKNGVLKAT
jgi:hypothetical protein